MTIAPKQIGIVEPVADLPAGGAVVLAVASRVEQCRSIVISQTTDAQTITLPAPTDTSVVFDLTVMNGGSVDFNLYGVTMSPGSMARFGWDGSQWVPDVAPTAGGSTIEVLTPTADNAVPNVAVAPQAGTSKQFFVNGDFVPAGITMDAAGAVTIDPAVVGYNVSDTDALTVVYYTA